MSKWMNIETAPIDYNQYLFFTKNGFPIVDGYVKKQGDIRKGRQRWRESLDNRYTHWMPLPEPPEGV